MKKCLIVIGMIVIGIVLIAPCQARAIVIYDSFGPGDTYTSSGFGIWGSDTHNANVFGYSHDVAVPFDIPTGSDLIFDKVELAAGLVTGANEFDIWLAGDDSNLPGAILEHFHFSNELTSIGLGSILSRDSIIRPTLNDGAKYWIIATPGSSDSFIGWYGVDGIRAYARRKNDGPWEHAAATINATLRVNGSVIPEPSSMLLFGFSLLGAGLLRRKRIK